MCSAKAGGSDGKARACGFLRGEGRVGGARHGGELEEDYGNN